MTDLRTFYEGNSRLPTAAETARQMDLVARGLLDVYADIRQVPELWPILLQATEAWIAGPNGDTFWAEWQAEIKWAFGRSDFYSSGYPLYKQLITLGQYKTSGGQMEGITLDQRLAAFEHTLDLTHPDEDLWPRLNERLRHFRVPLKLEGTRFIPLTSEHLHQEIVVPTLQLLKDPKFSTINDLYRKAWDRYLRDDHAGAITNVSGAIEQMLRLGGAKGSDLPQLIASAQGLGWFESGPAQMLTKLHAFRKDSDAHAAGTDDPEVSMLFLRIGGSLLHYLGTSLP